jgi:NAD(P)-dependent dehydrogenase (short-subunit alcohol dehydrogenase family)
MRIAAGIVAVVTGAASGIGRALAIELARRQCGLALFDINSGGLAETAALLPNGADASLHEVDVADSTRVSASREDVIARHGGVDVLVNNAGVAAAAPVDALALEDFRWLFGVNFWGAVHCCQAFLPDLRRRPKASIVNVLSGFALAGFPTKAAYCSSKFALRGFSETLRTELAGSGISVTCVYPGAVATDIVRHSRTWSVASRDREDAFLKQHSLPIEMVARRIVRGIEREKPRVLIGATTHVVDLASRMLPGATASLIGAWKDRISFLRDTL